MKLEESIGIKFNRLTVISDEGKIGKYRSCKAICECGNEVITTFFRITSGRKASCGCLTKERLIKMNFKHGATKHPFFPRWNMIRSRCYNTKNPRYPDYGGRGIKMCDEWLNNPFSFFKWLEKQRPEEHLSVDRIDNDGDYSPENCRLATKSQQALNQRPRRHYQGKPINKR